MGSLNSIAIAVNGEYAQPDCVIRPHNEIALIPPVSGERFFAVFLLLKSSDYYLVSATIASPVKICTLRLCVELPEFTRLTKSGGSA